MDLDVRGNMGGGFVAEKWEELVDRVDLRGAVVKVEAIYSEKPPILQLEYPWSIRLTYDDGRTVVVTPTGYEADGLRVKLEP